jgi:beta-lactamase class A
MEQASVDHTRLTSPFLEIAGEPNGDAKIVRARQPLLSFIRGEQENDPTLRVSVYARDLYNGPWIGIDEGELFVPASLNKVPVLIYILAQAESDPTLLDQSLVYPGPEAMTSPSSLEEGMDEFRMEAGTSYTYRDLLFRMIAYSDNHAKELLMVGISEADIEALMQVVHAGSTLVDTRYAVDAKTYASFFRILFNSNFLGRAMSEYALYLLTQSHFQGGIRRFIPEEVTIASKFGFNDSHGDMPHSAELHECGIIYQPEAPYVLCVMTRSGGRSVDEMAETIAQVSRIVWNTKTQ